MNKILQHLQRYALENPGEVKKMILSGLFFLSCTVIIFANASSRFFVRFFGFFSLVMTLCIFFAACVALYTRLTITFRLKKRVFPIILDKIPASNKLNILDIGSYQGRLPIALLQKMASSQVISLFPKMTQKNKAFRAAKKKVKRQKLQEKIKVREVDFKHLPFPDHSFDVVCSSLFFHTLCTETEGHLIEEILRVLKPNAAFIFFDMISLQAHYLNKEVRKSLKSKVPFSQETLSFEFYLKYSRKQKVIHNSRSAPFPCSRFLWGINAPVEKTAP